MTRQSREPGGAAAPPAWVRWAFVVMIATYAAYFVYLVDTGGREYIGSDFTQVWVGARELFAGRNPYAAVGPGRLFPFPAPLAYPATALVVAAPFAALPPILAHMAFVAIGTGALAWALSRRALWPLLVFASWPAGGAVLNVQWSPLMTTVAMMSPTVPVLAALYAAKPTLAVAYLAYRPTRGALVAAAVGGLVLAGFAAVFFPAWPTAWLTAMAEPPIPRVGRVAHFYALYRAPVSFPGGPLCLLALLRWRRPEARLLAVLACVPQTMFGYELLPVLALVPTTAVQLLALGLPTWVVWYVAQSTAGAHAWSWQEMLAFAGQGYVWVTLLPATALVLTRPNEGPAPAWLERALARAQLPTWLRGTRPASAEPDAA